MKRQILLVLSVILPMLMKAQEFICQVSVNAPQVEGSERKVFQTMQSAIYEFVNNRKWTNYVYKPEERIECSMMLTINDRVSSDQFKGRLNLVLQRPVYKTSYNTNLLNYIDTDIDFKYVEYEPLIYTDDAFTSNLTSVIAYYVYIFLGLDADSYSLMGGTPYFEKAKAIVNTAQNSQEKGWKAFESMRNRFWLVENLMNGAYSPLREGIYQYHRLGLDVMSDNIDLGRASVTECLENFQKAGREKPGLFILQLMTEAKRDELVNIYSQASPMDKTRAVNILKEIDPAH
ncbi:MAG TPA: DUF4835 family protein, partial [Bacteroidales bacterium]|nr:DUF4835 family protein [Bacteroidales bacterium]